MILIDAKGHMVSDASLAELHAFARGLRLLPKWFQDKRIPHYDLTTPLAQARALRDGAAVVSSKELVRRAIR